MDVLLILLFCTVLSPVIGGESVGPGGFRQYVYRRGATHRFEWAGEIDVSRLEGQLAELLAPAHRATVSLNISIELGDQEDPLQDSTPGAMSDEIEADDVSLLRMRRRRDDHLQFDRSDHEQDRSFVDQRTAI